MEKRRRGLTAIEVTPIGLGCWQFSQGQGVMGNTWGMVDQETITSIVRAARAGGVSWFDSAEAYGNGRSEQMLSAALQATGAKPGEAVIATKWQPFLRRADSIGRTIDRRLECLAPYPIDLYQIHNPMSFSPVPAQVREMARLLRAGKIGAIGVSNFNARQMEQAHTILKAEGVALASNQVRINLLNRRIEDNGVLSAAKKLGVTLIAYSPLAQGILTGRFHHDRQASQKVSGIRRLIGGHSEKSIARTRPLIDELEAIAKAYGTTPAQVALGWLITFYGETVVAIPGATKPAQAEQGAAAMSLHLRATELSRLDEVSRKCHGRSAK